MEALIITIISSAAAIVVSLLGVVLSNRKTNSIIEKNKDLLSAGHDTLSKGHDTIFKGHDTLSKEHKELSGEHKGLSSEHKELSDKLLAFKDKSTEQHGNISDCLKDMQHFIKLQALQRNSLIGKELDVKNTVEQLSALIDLLADQRALINELQAENQQLRDLLQKSENPKPHNEEQSVDEELEM